jgi:hypothetical protein
MNRRTVVAGTAAAALVAIPSITYAASPEPPREAVTQDVTFIKHLVDATAFRFEGTTGGDARGKLTSQLVRQTAPPTNEYQFVEFKWIITARHRSFTAITDGTLDLKTGVVAMTGTVTAGWHRGAEVLEKGQLTDPATSTFVGDIVILDRHKQG